MRLGGACGERPLLIKVLEEIRTEDDVIRSRRQRKFCERYFGLQGRSQGSFSKNKDGCAVYFLQESASSLAMFDGSCRKDTDLRSGVDQLLEAIWLVTDEENTATRFFRTVRRLQLWEPFSRCRCAGRFAPFCLVSECVRLTADVGGR